MTIKDLLNRLGNYYDATARCENCQRVQKVRVPKGVKLSKYFDMKRCVCVHCGCNDFKMATVVEVQKDNFGIGDTYY